MAIGTTKVHGFGGMHRGFICGSVTGDAAGGFAIGVLLRLSQGRLWIIRCVQGSCSRTKSEKKERNERRDEYKKGLATLI